MQQTVFLDGRDLIVWVHRTVYLIGLQRAISSTSANVELVRFADDAATKAFNDLASYAYRGDSHSRTEIMAIIDTFGHPAIAWLLTLWHEQRHFIDYVFTNYGAS